MANTRHMVSKIAGAMRDIGVEVDPALCSVQDIHDVRHVSIGLATVPEDEEARTMMRSAAHLVITELFPEINMNIDIQPPPSCKDPIVVNPLWIPSPAESITSWLKRQKQEVTHLLIKQCHNGIRATFQRIHTSFPWRHANKMCINYENVRNMVLQRFNEGCGSMMRPSSFVDHFFKTPMSLVNATELSYALSDVTLFLGRPADSLLEFYEVVYTLGRYNFTSVNPGTYLLYLRAFENVSIASSHDVDLTCPITNEIKNMTEGPSLARNTNRFLSLSVFRYVLDEFPWHDADNIRFRTRNFVTEMDRWVSHGTISLISITSMMQYVLPSMNTLLSTYDEDSVMKDVRSEIGEPDHLLHIYETVFRMVRRGDKRCQKATNHLYHKLFAS